MAKSQLALWLMFVGTITFFACSQPSAQSVPTASNPSPRAITPSQAPTRRSVQQTPTEDNTPTSQTDSPGFQEETILPCSEDKCSGSYYPTAIALSPTNEYLAVASETGLSLYRLNPVDQLWTVASESRLRSVAFTPDGTKIISGSETSEVVIWSIAGTELASWDEGRGGFPLEVSSDNTQIAVGASPLRLRDMETQALLAELDYTGEATGVESDIAWSPNLQYIAISDVAGNVVIWDANTHQLVRTIDVATQYNAGGGAVLTNLAWSPDSTRITVGNPNGLMGIWDVQSGEVLEQHQIFPTRYSADMWVSWNPFPDTMILVADYAADSLYITTPNGNQLVLSNDLQAGVRDLEWVRNLDEQIIVVLERNAQVRIWRQR